jgi:hypothetical protein
MRDELMASAHPKAVFATLAARAIETTIPPTPLPAPDADGISELGTSKFGIRVRVPQGALPPLWRFAAGRSSDPESRRNSGSIRATDDPPISSRMEVDDVDAEEAEPCLALRTVAPHRINHLHESDTRKRGEVRRCCPHPTAAA